MAQFGTGPEFAAQCPSVPTPDGWRPWIDADGPIPDPLLTRSQSLIGDQEVPLGTTESYPLPGVTTLIRVEPHRWGRNADGELVQGCFRGANIYLPRLTPTAEGGISTTSKIVGGLTVVSLAVGIVATVRSLRKR